MLRKSEYRFSGKIMLNLSIWRMIFSLKRILLQRIMRWRAADKKRPMALAISACLSIGAGGSIGARLVALL